MRTQDSNGLWHDDMDMDSNNVFWYGSVAKTLGLDVSKYPDYFKRCVVSLSRDNIIIHRHPNKPKPPFSHDEILGAFLLGLISYDILKGNHFVFYGHGKPFEMKDLQKVAEGMLELVIHLNINLMMPKSKKIKARNVFWEKRVEKLYTVAFRLNPAYIYCVKRIAGKKPHEEERVLYKFYLENLIKNKSNNTGVLSEKIIMWNLLVNMGDESSARKLNPVHIFTHYFGAEHIFTEMIRARYR